MRSLFIIVLLSFLAAGQSFSQDRKLNQQVFDPKANKYILIGYCNRDALHDSVFDAYYQKEYDEYLPDRDILSQMYPLLSGLTVTIVMATWCGDSREQVPRFYKIFDMLEHSFPDPDLICVDKDKKAPDVSLEGMNIERVPTFIFYFNGRELGRIIETPKETIEKDMLSILKK